MINKNFVRAQAEYDNRLPDDSDEAECPDCGDGIEAHEDGWRCVNTEDCGWCVYPDYDDQPILGEG